MRFTCLSPVTVSRIYDKTGDGETCGNGFAGEVAGLNKNIDNDGDIFGGAADFGCHYIRPWEDGLIYAKI